MQKGIKVIDDASAREIYSNRVVSTNLDGAVVVLTLGCARGVPERTGELPSDSVPVVVNNRVALPESMIVELHKLFGNVLETILERKNLRQPRAEPGKKPRQKARAN